MAVVEEDAHLGPLARRSALDGLALKEVGRGRGQPPDGLVEAAVDARVGGGAHGLDGGDFIGTGGGGQHRQGRGSLGE